MQFGVKSVHDRHMACFEHEVELRKCMYKMTGSRRLILPSATPFE